MDDYGTKILKKLLDKVKEMSNEEYINLFDECKEEYKEFEELRSRQEECEKYFRDKVKEVKE